MAFTDTLDGWTVYGALRGSGVVFGCNVSAQPTPSMNVNVAAGVVQNLLLDYAVAGATLAIAASDPVNDRYDCVVVDATGALQVRQNLDDATHIDLSSSALTAGDIPIAIVYITAGATSLDATTITDKRAILPGVRYPGDIQMTARRYATPGWALTDGSAFDRTDQSACFAAITYQTTGTFTSGSANVTGIPDTSPLVEGSPIEGANIPAGAIIQTITGATTITMSANATASGSATFRNFPWGNGDGSTTFNVPNFNDRFPKGPTLADNAVPSIVTIANTTGQFDASGSCLLNAPAGIAAGDLIVAMVSIDSPSSGLYPSTQLLGFNQVYGASSVPTTVVAFYKIATASEPASYTLTKPFTTSGDAVVASLFRITGHNAASPIEGFGVTAASGSATSLAVPGITTAHSNVLVLSACAVSSIKTFTESVGTEQSDISSAATTSVAHATNSRTQASPGATGSNTFTMSAASTNRAGLTIGIRPSQKAVIGTLGGSKTPVHGLTINGDGAQVSNRGTGTAAVNTLTHVHTGTIDSTTADHRPPWGSVNFEIKL